MDTEFTREIVEALGAAFPDDEVEFLPRGSYNGKARALAYIDARSVMRRLDAVVGPQGWSFDFDTLSPDGKLVKGKLTVLGVTKCDAGEGSTEDEPLKSAVSDALKRCAVHFGIGRYLYYLPQVWAPYDQQKRRFTEEPRIAPEAVAKALAICGIPAPGRQPAKGSYLDLRSEPRGDAAATAQRHAQAAEKSNSFGEATGATPPPTTSAPPARQDPPGQTSMPVDPSTLVCSGTGCTKALTRGQHDISLRAFGQPLCPGCQKEKARAAA